MISTCYLILDSMALAPRKKLWSTPTEVLDEALALLALTAEDVAVDIGAGDGRFLLLCAEKTPVRLCMGVEIDEERGASAQAAIVARSLQERVKMIIGNALEQDYSEGTAFFLYLVPRGLRIILPLLKRVGRRLRVVTYMSPFPDSEKPLRVIKVSTEQHPEAQWPLYYYELEPGAGAGAGAGAEKGTETHNETLGQEPPP